jgi:hypothetical protein
MSEQTRRNRASFAELSADEKQGNTLANRREMIPIFIAFRHGMHQICTKSTSETRSNAVFTRVYEYYNVLSEAVSENADFPPRKRDRNL